MLRARMAESPQIPSRFLEVFVGVLASVARTLNELWLKTGTCGDSSLLDLQSKPYFLLSRRDAREASRTHAYAVSVLCRQLGHFETTERSSRPNFTTAEGPCQFDSDACFFADASDLYETENAVAAAAKAAETFELQLRLSNARRSDTRHFKHVPLFSVNFRSSAERAVVAAAAAEISAAKEKVFCVLGCPYRLQDFSEGATNMRSVKSGRVGARTAPNVGVEANEDRPVILFASPLDILCCRTNDASLLMLLCWRVEEDILFRKASKSKMSRDSFSSTVRRLLQVQCDGMPLNLQEEEKAKMAGKENTGGVPVPLGRETNSALSKSSCWQEGSRESLSEISSNGWKRFLGAVRSRLPPFLPFPDSFADNGSTCLENSSIPVDACRECTEKDTDDTVLRSSCESGLDEERLLDFSVECSGCERHSCSSLIHKFHSKKCKTEGIWCHGVRTPPSAKNTLEMPRLLEAERREGSEAFAEVPESIVAGARAAKRLLRKNHLFTLCEESAEAAWHSLGCSRAAVRFGKLLKGLQKKVGQAVSEPFESFLLSVW